MIDPKSLRIGNTVTDEFYDSFKKVITVESINDKGINLGIQDSDDYPEMQTHWIEPYYTFDQLRGIPLSEQELIRLGFKPEGNLNYTRYRHRNPDALFSFGNYARPNDDPESKPTLKVSCLDGQTNQVSLSELKYVHQLQNQFYYNSGGTELIYKVDSGLTPTEPDTKQ